MRNTWTTAILTLSLGFTAVADEPDGPVDRTDAEWRDQVRQLSDELAAQRLEVQRANESQTERLTLLSKSRSQLIEIYQLLQAGSSDVSAGLFEVGQRVMNAADQASQFGAPAEVSQLQNASSSLTQVGEALDRSDFQAAKEALFGALHFVQRAELTAQSTAPRP